MGFQSDRLRKARDQSGMTQRKLGGLIGLGVNQISRYEQGAQDPSTDILAKLAQHLRVTTDYLLGLTDDPYGYQKFELTEDEIQLLGAYTAGDTTRIMELSVSRVHQLREEGA